MKKFSTLMLFLLVYSGFTQEVKRESHQIIEPRSIYLNGGMRSNFGGKSRTYLKIDLPPNTVQWYYSFSTSKGKSGVKNLNLALQVSSLFSGSGAITSTALSSIKVPSGSGSIDVYLCDRENIDLFYDKADRKGSTFYHIMEGTVENTKQAVVQINDVKTNTWYLGLKNPSSLDGINISIEVVAITEKVIIETKSQEQEKAELYGNLGWAQFENGNYLKCIAYCDKANAAYKLGWVNANKGLAQLIIGQEDMATETYINAISLIKKQPNPDYIFKEVVKDIDNALKVNPELKGAQEIKKIIGWQ
ncbi:tetratricopeptide repeat protein [Flavivirga algicola]|uniref:Tetratricopeptide repeat protein n=1 Tax=Flavivirga algicola TaxID=2729136 RepID=A0ABX1RV37_9FLAO|nr:tetratricopeptide repeat protein [Flavivirga algicola]NMH86918.1 hypothetical protein [Flavivirga algicola]